jgi:glyoxylase-like metal-dependent hydrolase (beta-lactamase superfamily II)
MQLKNLTPNSIHGIYLIQGQFNYLIDSGSNDIEYKQIFNNIPNKKLDYLILTNLHCDHIRNIENFKNDFNLTIIAGPSKKESQFVDKIIQDGEILPDDEIQIKFLHIPGLTEQKEEIGILFQDKNSSMRYLFCGDHAQPCGLDLSNSDFYTPFPFFDNAQEYIASLEKLLSVENDFDYLITGHNSQLDRIMGRQWLWVTKESVKLLLSMCEEMIIRNPTEFNLQALARFIFDWYCKERHNIHKTERFDPTNTNNYWCFEEPAIIEILKNMRKKK